MAWPLDTQQWLRHQSEHTLPLRTSGRVRKKSGVAHKADMSFQDLVLFRQSNVVMGVAMADWFCTPCVPRPLLCRSQHMALVICA